MFKTWKSTRRLWVKLGLLRLGFMLYARMIN